MKLTKKMFAAYERSRRAGWDGLVHNDNWNRATYVITLAESYAIDRAVSDEYGLCPPDKLDFLAIKRRLEDL